MPGIAHEALLTANPARPRQPLLTWRLMGSSPHLTAEIWVSLLSAD
jgi:hypothetical protein